MPADVRKLAQEAVELAGKATPGPWVQSDPEFGDHDTSHFICSGDKEDPAAPLVATAEPRMDSVQAMGDAGLIAHAGTHYATIARALIEALDERDEARRNYQFMVDRAADEKLDGYRELGSRAAAAENDLDKLLAALPHAVGSCKCERQEWDETRQLPPWPEEHEAAIEWLRGRIE